jgi:hypothetical protein
VSTQARPSPCKPVKISAWVLVSGWLALANCDAIKRPDAQSVETARPAQSAADPPALSGPAEAERSSSIPLVRTEPANSHCEPLARPPKTERRELAPQGKYETRASYLYALSSDTAVDDGINGAIATDLEARRREFTKSADELIETEKNDPEPLAPNRVALDIQCEQSVTTATLLSITCTSSRDLGGAYPNLESFAYNFALCAGTRAGYVTLASLCKPDAPCTKAILDLIRHKLAARQVDVTLDEHAEALKQFAITRSGFRFFANDDLPHVIQSKGIVDVPFERLHAVLRHDGPLAGLFTP